MNGSPERRFWAKVDKHGPVPDYNPTLGPCWMWTAAAETENHYGMIRANGRMMLVHRFAYELLVGPIRDGLELDHVCRVRKCCRPEHLEPVTSLENHDRSKPFRKATHCLEGHEMTKDNVRVTSTGIRVCKTCSPDQRPDFDERCANGHPWTSATTAFKRDGRRYCRVCARDAQARWKAKQLAAQ